MVKQLEQLDEYGYPSEPDTRQRARNALVQGSKRLLLAGIYSVMSVIGVVLTRKQGKNLPALSPQTFHPTRILVIRLDLIGDLVMSLTLVRALKRTYPNAEIDLLALPSSAPIAAYGNDLTRIFTYDANVWRRPWALLQIKHWRNTLLLLRHLRTRNYDLAVSVFGSWAAVLARLSGARRCLGFGRESYPGFMTDSIPGRHWAAGDRKHEVDYCLELAQAAGAQLTTADRVPHLDVDPQARVEVELLLRREGIEAISGKRPLIACHVSAHNGQSKRWPIPYWATLLDHLVRDERVIVIFTGTRSDLPLIERIQKHMQEHTFNLAGKTSLSQLAALLQRADLLITGDSGPMHIAAAVGAALIAIHGPTDPAMTGPVSPRATVLRSTIWCSPCYRAQGPADCRFRTTQCMKNILPSRVLEVVREKLQESIRPTSERRNV